VAAAERGGRRQNLNSTVAANVEEGEKQMIQRKDAKAQRKDKGRTDFSWYQHSRKGGGKGVHMIRFPLIPV
jgi:predicted lipoprotein with Yx(FWY)xxD motif